MESVIKKISQGIKDSEVHADFVKYSKGVFENKYLVDAKKKSENYSIKTGPEFANFLVKYGLSKINGKVSIKGVIVSTFDIRGESNIEIKGVKQFMGIKQAQVEGSYEVSEIMKLMEKFPKAFFALSFENSQTFLKIKEKAPKSAKPSTKGGEDVKADFCTVKTSDENLVKDLLFGIDQFKEISISHSIVIEDIILPKGEKDPVKIRSNAVRKGKILRKIKMDGVRSVKEIPFEA